jgi:PAS domain S-box-containing protein
LRLIASVGVDCQAGNIPRIDSKYAAAKALVSGELLLVDGPASPSTSVKAGKQVVIKSLIYIPVRHETQVVGVLSIGSEDADAFRPETSSVLTAYAQALGALLQSGSAFSGERLESAVEASVETNSAENSRQAIDARFRAVVAQSPHMVFVSRLDHFRFVEVNDRACEHYGYSREEFLEMEIFDIEIEPPLREQVRSLYDSTLPGQEVEVFGTNKRKDETTFPAHVRFAKLDDVLAMANVRDISEVKIAEDSLRVSEARSDALLEEAPQMVVADASGVIIRVNRQLEVQFGYSREELIGSKVEVLIPESTRPNHAALRAGYAENPTSRLMGEGLRLSGLRKDGSEFPVEIGLSSIESSDGRLTLAHVMDATQRRELEEILTATGEQLGDQLEARDAEIELVERVARIFTSTLDISQVFAEFAEEAKNLVDFDQITIVVIDYATESLFVNRYLRAGFLAGEPRVVFDLKGSQTEQLLLTGKTIIRDSLDVDNGFYTDRYFQGVGLRSTILTPLVYNDQTIGSVLLASNQPGSFGPREQRILERLAHRIAPAVENSRLYEESISRTAELECLLDLAEILGRTQPYEEKVYSVLEQMVRVVDGFSAHFRVYDPDNDELVLAASAGTQDEPGFIRPERMESGSTVYYSFKQGSPLVVADYFKDSKALPAFGEMGDRSVVFLPIGVGGKPVAVMTVDSNELNHFTPERVRLLTAVSEGLGTLMENANLHEELQAGTEEMAMVDRVADIVNSSLSLDEICKRYATEVNMLVDFHNANLTLIDDQKIDSALYFLRPKTLRRTWTLPHGLWRESRWRKSKKQAKHWSERTSLQAIYFPRMRPGSR